MTRLRRLHPEPVELDLDDLYAGLTLPAGTGGGRAGWVALGMVSSVDGAVTVEGRSGALGGEADLLALQRLRDAADVVLVGAGTVRTEGYDALAGTPGRRRDRHDRGLAPRPRLAIVTGSAALSTDLPAFTDPSSPPLVLAGSAAEHDDLRRLERVADVLVLDAPRPGGAQLVDALVAAGLPRIACEGGPRLNAALHADDRVDELFLTLAPLLVGAGPPRVVEPVDEHRSSSGAAAKLELVEAHEHGGELLLRYRVSRPDAGHRPVRERSTPVSRSGPPVPT